MSIVPAKSESFLIRVEKMSIRFEKTGKFFANFSHRFAKKNHFRGQISLKIQKKLNFLPCGPSVDIFVYNSKNS